MTIGSDGVPTVPNRVIKSHSMLHRFGPASFLLLAGLAAPAHAFWSCDWILSMFSPTHYARWVVHRGEAESTPNHDRLKRLEAMAVKLGSPVRLSPFRPPEANVMVLSREVKDLLDAEKRTPEVLLREFGDREPRFAPLIKRLLDDAAAKKLPIQWGYTQSSRGERDIVLGTNRFDNEHPELTMLVTLAHELRHEYYVATPTPGETRKAFLARWQETLLKDELGAIDAGVTMALEIENLGGPKAESLVWSVSASVLALRRKPYDSARRQETAEREALRYWEKSWYPKAWEGYLASRWDAFTRGEP